MTRSFESDNSTAAFLSAMRDRDLILQAGKALCADGKYHRCDVASKAKHGIGDGSYVFSLNPVPHGGFNNWTDGRGYQGWRFNTSRKLTPEEQAEIKRAMELARSHDEKQRARARAEARVKAKRMWRSADRASNTHAYCKSKQVTPEGLKTMRFKDGEQALLVPMYDGKSKLQNLQLIHRDGSKIFLRGGRQKGCHFWVASPDDDTTTICICEGWATGESVFEATGYGVIVSFGDGNLLSVAEWVRQKYPDQKIIIAADDDWKQPGNPGLTKAREAAGAVKGLIADHAHGRSNRAD
jgi:putative DNA primase/helicase